MVPPSPRTSSLEKPGAANEGGVAFQAGDLPDRGDDRGKSQEGPKEISNERFAVAKAIATERAERAGERSFVPHVSSMELMNQVQETNGESVCP